MLKNKFNLLTSKVWLPFQKSWFRYDNDEKLYLDNLQFFTKSDDENPNVVYIGTNTGAFVKIAEELDLKVINPSNSNDSLQFVLFDLRESIAKCKSVDELNQLAAHVIQQISSVYHRIQHRRFVGIIASNWENDTQRYPFAWELGLQVAEILSLKDEKILCHKSIDTTTSGMNTDYVLYFRKDENSAGLNSKPSTNCFSPSKAINFPFTNEWFILKPPPRKKDEILHPAKYPEILPEKYILSLSKEGEMILDPMSGTGSTLIAAAKHKRKAFGTELSSFFAEIANQRIDLNGFRDLASIACKDALLLSKEELLDVRLMITSPPYWDMLNMKGAEYQARRKEKGLQLNYSDHPNDLGNQNDYFQFVDMLVNLYIYIGKNIKKGSTLTIVVKNVKKKGKNYPLAWHLAARLSKEFDLLPEQFWCQDDISIAPYGYGNTWVSNTFHQYILNFRTRE